jgi:hypothetical protein
MISATAAPKPVEATYACGPVKLELAFDSLSLRDALHESLSQYDAPWPTPATSVHVKVEGGTPPSKAAESAGTYLRSRHLVVDRLGPRLRSVSYLGVWMEFDPTSTQARVMVPAHPDWPALVEDVEQQFVLLLARAWAQEGWTPLHAGTLVPPGETRCVLLCAPSGIGKTTLTVALLRRGWRTLGDDKTLLRKEGKGVMARAVAHRFHLHPSLSRWFPEAGNLSLWPRYSRWTDKRVVRIKEVWPDRLRDHAIPAAVAQLERTKNGPALLVEPLDQINTLKTLLQQVVIPGDAEHARPLVSCVTATAAGRRGALVKIGDDAFADPLTAEHLDQELRRLLA